MLPDEQGRFCSSCNKSVIDFTLMDDKEIYTTLLKGTAETCGRLTQQQLDGVIKYETEKWQRWHKYFFSFLVPAFLLVKQAGAQKIIGKLRATATTAVCDNSAIKKMRGLPAQKYFEFSGVITDAISNEALSSASIQIKDAGRGVISDSSGNFKLTDKTTWQTVTIVIRAIGFATREVNITVPADGFMISDEKIKLQKMATMLKAVCVKSTIETGLFGYLGGISMRTSVRKTTLFKAKIVTALNDSLKIFPNPVERGNTFTAALRLKQSGAYVLQVVDVTGRLVWQQQINVASKIHNQNIECNAAWITGIYFLRVIGNGNKVISTSKFLVK
ncbi:MAG: carboxypeptidase-like regulatory domain-containing protein [Aquabacterium sp.]|nr:carboxypeptidase-like regulatory domain-containing protein [Ferruginibacter sp.]